MLMAAVLAASQLAQPVAPIVRVETPEKVVALTFDACATRQQANGFDRAVFNLLKREHLPATIFLTGRWIAFHPREARELASVDTLALGNHGDDHRTLTALPDAQVRVQLDRANKAIRRLGREPIAFRPPSGAWNERCVRLAGKLHLPTILWDVVPGDPAPMSAKRMIATVGKRTRPGSIVVFHINGRGRHTAEALPVIVSQLRRQGYRFVTVRDLLALPDARPAFAPTRTPAGRRRKG
jgi:peptidoglycan/xylan/chitin deacetylase (PgdA/CDA1 family)